MDRGARPSRDGASLGLEVVWPPHVEYREWPTVVVEGRSADDFEAERFVEAARRGVLLVDLARQVAVAELLGARYQPAPAALSAACRLEEERCDVMAGEPHEADRHVCPLCEYPEFEHIISQGLPDKGSQRGDVGFRQEIVRRPHGALPQRDQRVVVRGTRATDLPDVVHRSSVPYAARPSARSRVPFGCAPIVCALGAPFSNKIMFGIDWTP